MDQNQLRFKLNTISCSKDKKQDILGDMKNKVVKVSSETDTKFENLQKEIDGVSTLNLLLYNIPFLYIYIYIYTLSIWL